jgi:oligoendopeptidase F
MNNDSAAAVCWNLRDLFDDIDDPRIEETLQTAKKRADEFQRTYQGKIDSPTLTAQTLLAAIREVESISLDAAKPPAYASLRFSADTTDTAVQAFMQKMMERSSEISIPLIFFDLELANAKNEVIEPLMADPCLADYLHFIRRVRVYREHMLSEPEEKLSEELANTGARAFRRLFEQITSSQKFEMDGKQLTQSEVLAKLYSPDRQERKEAAESFTRGLAHNLPTVTFVSNTLIQDKAVKDRLRRYENPEQSRHMSNELEPETVELVAGTCERNYDVVSRYYKIKREILGVEKLMLFDRYAPLFDAVSVVLWNEARDIVLESFGAFSPVMRDVAAEFYEKGWIDAAPRPGKRGGAFCAYATPDLHPFILMSYLERGRDVTTIAHELGHGVHAWLSRCQSFFNYHGTLPLAELASTFCEMLVFQNVRKRVDPKQGLALLGGKIEDTFATIFRQATMYRFEQRIHEHRRVKGELTSEQFGDYWQSAIQAMFGDSMELGDDHRIWWSYIGHFVGTPFYVYAYSFGELLALSLYQMSRENGPDFAEKYLAMLRCGGSLSPHELMAKVDVDLDDPKFWQGGVDFVKSEVDDFERMWNEYKATL